MGEIRLSILDIFKDAECVETNEGVAASEDEVDEYSFINQSLPRDQTSDLE
jgi:hypothetical protein